MANHTLTRDDILAYLHTIDNELATAQEPQAPPTQLLLCGGAVMALLGLRDSTLDIDSALPLSPALKEATRRVATRQGIHPATLNDAAAAWKPATVAPEECPLVLNGKRLQVQRLDCDSLFLMKLNASRPYAADLQDLARLAPLASFGSPASIQEAYEEAYPGESRDPFLGQFAWDRYFHGAHTSRE